MKLLLNINRKIMKYEQFKDVDVDGKLNALFEIINNHIGYHSKINIFLLGILSAVVVAIATGLISKYLF